MSGLLTQEERTSNSQSVSQRKRYVTGMKDILPVAASGIVDGIVFGILAIQAGLGIFEAMLFSLIINAGSSQFAAVGLISQGVIGWPMLVSTALLNARHMLYGLSLGPFFKKTSGWKLSLLAAQLNDETFAVKITYLNKTNKPSMAYFFGASLTDYAIWNGSTLIGTLLGTIILNPEKWGLDFAFIATFIGFLAINLKNKFYVVAAIVASVFACIGYYINGLTMAILFGTIAAMIVGAFYHE